MLVDSVLLAPGGTNAAIEEEQEETGGPFTAILGSLSSISWVIGEGRLRGAARCRARVLRSLY